MLSRLHILTTHPVNKTIHPVNNNNTITLYHRYNNNTNTPHHHTLLCPSISHQNTVPRTCAVWQSRHVMNSYEQLDRWMTMDFNTAANGNNAASTGK